MILDIIQITSGLHDTQFIIKDKEDHLLGDILLKEKNQHYTITLHYQEKEYIMTTHEPLKDLQDKPLHQIDQIRHLDKVYGYIYETMEEKSPVQKMLKDSHSYELYVPHFGKNDMSMSLYQENTQIAQIETDFEVNGENLYNYHLYLINHHENDIITIMMLMFYYQQHTYQSGTMAPQIQTEYKADDYVYSKYNPTFIESMLILDQ